MPTQPFTPDSFTNFGDLLKYLRRRQRLTQLELSIAVGYSESQISRLEKNQRLPDPTALKALFIPALQLENERDLLARLFALAESARQEEPPAPGLAPYKGLLFFDESDADLFFGREALTARLVERMTDLALDSSLRFLAVVGASGSGKSSLVRAGLLAALKRAGWCTYVFTPTAQPLKLLETQLDSMRPGENREHILLLVDQFEETFTLCHEEATRLAFVEKLLTLATSSLRQAQGELAESQGTVANIVGNIVVVIALRADFYAHCAQYPRLRGAVAAHQEYIGQMTTEELRRAIEEPANRGGWEFEPGLVDLLLSEIGAHDTGLPEPGALPLLSHALLATWERRRGRTFTLDGYRAAGGVRRAIAETAESVFADQLNPAQQELARDLFLRLTELGEGTEDTRRRAGLTELVRQSTEAAQLRAVLDTLADARLITLNEDSAEVAHEALIREWQRLHEWLMQDREGLRTHRHLTDAAREWAGLGRDEGALYRGARLAQAQEWAGLNDGRLNELERAFLAASLAQEQQEEQERERQRQRELAAAQKLAEEQAERAREQTHATQQLRRSALLLAGALVLTLVAALVAGSLARSNATLATQNAASAAAAQAAGRQAQASFANAESQRLAAESSGVLQRGESAERAALLALRGLHIQYTPQADAALQRASRAYYGERLFQHPARVDAIAFAPDGRTFLSGSGDGIVHLWDVQTGEEIRQFKGHSDRFSEVVFSPDGRLALTSNRDKTARLWDVQTGRELRRFEHMGEADLVAFAPDGTAVWTGDDRVAQLWRIDTGALVRKIETGDWAPLDVSPDGVYLLVAHPDGRMQLWDAQSGQPLRTLNGAGAGVSWAHFAANGRYILSDAGDNTAILWETASGEKLRTFTGHTENVFDADLSADGSLVVTASLDTTARLWDSATGAERYRLAAHTGSVHAAAFSPDGQFLLTASTDSTVRLWDLGKLHEPDSFAAQQGLIFGLAFSPDGKQLLTGSSGDRTAVLWDVTSGRQLKTLQLASRGDTVLFSRDGAQVLSASGYGGPPQLFDLQSGAELLRLDEDNSVLGVAFSPAGDTVVTANHESVSVWDIQTRQRVKQFSVPNGTVVTIALSPDGKTLVTGSDGTKPVRVRLWDLASGQQVQGFDDPAPVNSVAFSPNGKYILSGGTDYVARLWEVASGQLVRTFVGHTFWIWGVGFSPDGKYVLTASQDRTARLWDASTGQQLRLFPSHTNAAIANAIFAPDGRSVVVGSFDGVAQRTPTDLDDLIHSVCGRLLRDLTDEERTIYGIANTEPTCQAP